MRAFVSLPWSNKHPGMAEPDIWIRTAAMLLVAGTLGCSRGAPAIGGGGSSGEDGGGPRSDDGGIGGMIGSGGMVGTGGMAGSAGMAGAAATTGAGGTAGAGGNIGTGGVGGFGSGGSHGCSADTRPTGGCVAEINGVCTADPLQYVCGPNDAGWVCPLPGTFPREQCTCSGPPAPRSFYCPPDAGVDADSG
jgi:hypothetical protein